MTCAQEQAKMEHATLKKNVQILEALLMAHVQMDMEFVAFFPSDAEVLHLKIVLILNQAELQVPDNALRKYANATTISVK